MGVIHDVIPAFELFQPATVDDVLGLLDRHAPDTWLMAGGMDSFDWFKDRIRRPRVVIDLSGVEQLRGIKEANGGLEIGAMTTLTDLSKHAVVKDKFGLLMIAADHVASPQIRNIGTLGGNVAQDTRCWYYRQGWPCYRAGGNICYADTPTAINREHAIFEADRCVAPLTQHRRSSRSMRRWSSGGLAARSASFRLRSSSCRPATTSRA
jgi:xanthine dehydrogenase YagS FAD-binding subunit